MPLWRKRRLDNLWILWELGLLNDDEWPPSEVLMD